MSNPPPAKRRRTAEASSPDVDSTPSIGVGSPQPETETLTSGRTSSPLPLLTPEPAQFCLVPQPQPDGTDPSYPVLPRPPHVRRVHPALPGPSTLEYIVIYHPFRNLDFLWFPAYDHLDDSQFGCHHETVLTGCTIVAFNRAGYLSTSRNRNDDRIPLELEILSPAIYYYHLQGARRTKDYPICDDFHNWSFPHNKLPPAWAALPDVAPAEYELAESGASDWVRKRDKVCLISRSEEYLSMAHVVPMEEECWLRLNKMSRYLGNKRVLCLSVHNVFALQYNLRMGGFDQHQFAMVPKHGKLLVHFLRLGHESAGLYHNTVFEHGGIIPRELLYARFAWALFGLVKDGEVALKRFNVRRPGAHSISGSASAASGSEQDTDQDGQQKRKGKGRKGGGTSKINRSVPGRKKLNGMLQKFDPFLVNVLLDVAPGDPKSIEADAREIQDDLSTVLSHSLFKNPDALAPADVYYGGKWYPGVGVVDRRKQTYIEQHPRIRECAGSRFQSASPSPASACQSDCIS